MLTPKQRLRAAIEGGATDRRVFAPILSLYGARLTNCPLDTFYHDPMAFVRGAVAVQKTFGPDVLFAPFSVAAEGEAFGAEVDIPRRGAPVLKQPAASTVDQVVRLPLPDVDTHPRLQFVRAAIRGLVAELEADDRVPDTPVVAIALSPTELPPLLVGMGPWLTTLLSNAEARTRLLQFTTEFFVQWANALLSDGAACLAIPALTANLPMIPRQVLAEQIIPVWEASFAMVNGPILFHHGGGPLLPTLAMLRDLPNVAGFVVDATDSLDEARTILGPKKLLLGGPDGPTLRDRTVTEIGDDCRRILENRSEDPCFAFCTTAADVDYDTPIANITAMHDAIHEHSVALTP